LRILQGQFQQLTQIKLFILINFIYKEIIFLPNSILLEHPSPGNRIVNNFFFLSSYASQSNSF